MNQITEERVREIVQEELKKNEATAVTIAPTITLSPDSSIETMVKSIVSEIDKAIAQKRTIS